MKAVTDGWKQIQGTNRHILSVSLECLVTPPRVKQIAHMRDQQYCMVDEESLIWTVEDDEGFVYHSDIAVDLDSAKAAAKLALIATFDALRNALLGVE